MPKIIYHDSDGVDKTFVLGRDALLIGRATECQIQTLDAMVSRRHARIFWDGGYWIEDLGSSNGVYVGSQKVDRAPFNAGDVVVCGSLVLRLEAEAMDMAPSVPPVAPAPAPIVQPPAPAPAPVMAAPVMPAPAPVPQPYPPSQSYERTPAPVLPPQAHEPSIAANVEPSQVIEVLQPATPTPAPVAPDYPPPPPRPSQPVQPAAAPYQPTTNPDPAPAFSPDAMVADVERAGRQAAEAEREDLRRQLDSAKIKQAADHRRVQDLEAELAAARKSAPTGPDPELEAARTRIAALEAELKKSDSIADELDALRQKHSQVSSELLAAQAAGSDRAQKAEAERDELRRRVAQLAEEASQKQRTFDDEREQLEQKLSAATGAGADAARLGGELETLRAELQKAKTAETERDELRKRLAVAIEDATQRVRAVEDERDRAERKASDLETTLKSAGAAAEELAGLRTKIGSLEADVAEAKKAAARVGEESAAKLHAFEEMRDQYELKIADLEGKANAVAALTTERDQLKKQLAEAGAASGDAAAQTGQLRSALQATQADVQHLTSERDQLRQQLADAQKAAAAAAAAGATAGAAAGELDALKQKIAVYERELRQADATADELDRQKARNAVMEEELAAAKAAAAKAASAAPAAAAVDPELEKRAAAADAATAKAHALEGEVAGLRERLAAAEKRAADAATEATATAAPASGGGKVDPAALETLTQLSDALAELRLSLRTANDESTQLSQPPQSVQVVTEALTQATDHLENARSQARALGQFLGS